MAEAQTVRIAVAQYPLDRFDSLADYIQKLERWIAEAAADKAELLVFPEYGAMEYAAIDRSVAGNLAASLAVAAEAMQRMEAAHASAARKHHIHILAASGPFRRADGSYVNRAKLFGPSGVYGWQDKLIMTPFEASWGITAGKSLRIFETSLGRIGIAICYDSEFPVLVRAMCEAGAELILIPSCTEFVSGYHRVRTAALARALENGCVTVQSTLIGDAPWSPAVDRNVGFAGIFVPAEQGLSDTGILAVATDEAPCWVTRTVDLARLRAVRLSGEMRNAQDWARQPGAASLSALVELHSVV